MLSFLLSLFTLGLVALAPAYAWGFHYDGGYDHYDSHRESGPIFPLSRALPNPQLTPGAFNPAVTQSTIHQTICVRGYTRSIRPPEHYTEALKRRQIREYGYSYSDSRLGYFEEDHLASLELGGAPYSPKNLWPEPHRVEGNWGSYTKDRLENYLRRQVCSGRMSLRDAQHDITVNWIATYKHYLGSPNRR